MMYYRHFGLSGAPFQFTPSSGMLFASRSHSEGLAALENSFADGAGGVTLLSGPPGSGKTTLTMAMLARGRGRSRVIYLANPKVGYAAMLREILRQVGIAEYGSQYEMATAIREHVGGFGITDRILILIDEAHHLSDASLEQISEFLGAAADGPRNLSFALIGQHKLIDRIASPGHESLHKLVSAGVELKPLSWEESLRYVEYRLASYGGSAESVFSLEALEYLLKHADGSPIRINVLCHNAMLLAHAANAHRVEIGTARKALSDFTSRAYESNPVKPARTARYNAERRAESRQNSPAAAAAPAVVPVSKVGMGIGLFIACALVLGVIWLAEMRPQETYSGGGWSDAEIPSIFSEEVNASDSVGWNNLGSTDGNLADASTQQMANEPATTIGKKIAGSNQGGASFRRPVTISEGGSAGNLKAVAPGENLPQAVTN